MLRLHASRALQVQVKQFPFMAESPWTHNDGADRIVNTHSFGHRVKYKLTNQPLAGDSKHFWHDTRA